MIEARDVGQLHHEGSLQQPLLVDLTTELRREIHQLRPEPFSSSRYQVAGGLGDERGIGHGNLPQLLLEADREGFDVEGQDDSRGQRMN